MPTTTNMSMVLPTEGASDNVWDMLLNAALTLNDAHDHTTGKGVKVPSAGLNVNADISFAGLWATTAMRAVDFTPVAPASVSSLSSALFANDSDAKNLYYRTAAGANVQITDGAALNVSAFTGGIGGDYSTAGALVAYVDADHDYTIKTDDPGGGRLWASISSGHVDLHELNSTAANRVRLQSPAALAASYSVTWPAALPASTSIVQVSSTGVLTASNTIVGGEVQASGFRHTAALSVTLPASALLDRLGTHAAATGASGATNHYILGASTNPLVWPLEAKEGDVITSFGVWVDKNTNGAAAISARLYKTSGTTGTETALGAGDSDTSDAPGSIVLAEAGLTEAVAEDEQYYLVITPSGSVTGSADLLYHAAFSFTRPL